MIKVINWLRNVLYDPRARGVNVDEDQLLTIHRQILLEKPLMRHVFEDFYVEMMKRCDRNFDVEGLEVELGSGAGFFKDMRPNLVSSDVRHGGHIDRVLDAQNLALPDASVRSLYATNVFHHLSDPEQFFLELIRVLSPGGGCILIEPHHGPVSSFIHTHLHTDEQFDCNMDGWKNPHAAGPLSGANQALAYLVFNRDRELFESKFGAYLEILEIRTLKNGLRYLMSGGVNFRQLFPSFGEPLLKAIEWLLTPVLSVTALHQIIVIRRRSVDTKK